MTPEKIKYYRERLDALEQCGCMGAAALVADLVDQVMDRDAEIDCLREQLAETQMSETDKLWLGNRIRGNAAPPPEG